MKDEGILAKAYAKFACFCVNAYPGSSGWSVYNRYMQKAEDAAGIASQDAVFGELYFFKGTAQLMSNSISSYVEAAETYDISQNYYLSSSFGSFKANDAANARLLATVVTGNFKQCCEISKILERRCIRYGDKASLKRTKEFMAYVNAQRAQMWKAWKDFEEIDTKNGHPIRALVLWRGEQDLSAINEISNCDKILSKQSRVFSGLLYFQCTLDVLLEMIHM